MPPPFLLLTGTTPDVWSMAAGILGRTDHPPRVAGPAVTAPPSAIASLGDETLWRIDLSVPTGAATHYTVDGERYPLRAPAADGPFRAAFVSCDGAEDEAKLRRAGPLVMWERLAVTAGERPIDLMIHGGDQIYADGVEQCHPAVAASWLRPGAPDLPVEAVETVRAHYWSQYRALYAKGTVGPVLASVPSVTMWDDHDVYDGYGSHAPERETAPAMLTVRRLAAEAFYAFQRLEPPQEDASLCFDLGGVGLVIPDLRSHRSPDRVMRPEDHARLSDQLRGLRHCRRVLVSLSVPLLGMESGWLESLLLKTGLQTGFSDDLRDQFCSPAHADERAALLDAMASLSHEAGIPVDLVSGEIHMAGLAEARGRGVTLRQYIASGISHPPPSRLHALLTAIAPRRPRVIAGLECKLTALPDHAPGFVADRNWLELDIGESGALTARWHFENRPEAILRG